MSEDEWDNLMCRARRQSELTGERVEVRAVLWSPRSTRYLGRKWGYVIMAPLLSPLVSRRAEPKQHEETYGSQTNTGLPLVGYLYD